MREIIDFINREGPVTYEQLSKHFHYKDLTYHHLQSLIKDGTVLKIQSGDIFLYKINNNNNNNNSSPSGQHHESGINK